MILIAEDDEFAGSLGVENLDHSQLHGEADGKQSALRGQLLQVFNGKRRSSSSKKIKILFCSPSQCMFRNYASMLKILKK